jgi:hypothetical protein
MTSKERDNMRQYDAYNDLFILPMLTSQSENRGPRMAPGHLWFNGGHTWPGAMGR